MAGLIPQLRTRSRASSEQRRLRALARAFPLLERLGVHVTLNHFYEPVPELRALPEGIFEREYELPGVDLREAEQLELLGRLAAFRDEYAHFSPRPVAGQPSTYYQRNLQFERVDAEVLYSMIRLHKPRRMIEVGAGFSTLVATAAIRRNQLDDPSYGCELTSVDPHPREFLDGLPGLARLVEAKVQDLPLDFFAGLGADDILFIDSSHVLKIGSDVQYELLELVPRVAPGVLVQVHDIFFPTDYPRVFVMDWHRFWNEQYLLQAFLAFNSEFGVRWSSSYMAHRQPDAIRAAFPSFERGGIWPSSLWMQRIPAA